MVDGFTRPRNRFTTPVTAIRVGEDELGLSRWIASDSATRLASGRICGSRSAGRLRFLSSPEQFSGAGRFSRRTSQYIKYSGRFFEHHVACPSLPASPSPARSRYLWQQGGRRFNYIHLSVYRLVYSSRRYASSQRQLLLDNLDRVLSRRAI